MGKDYKNKEEFFQKLKETYDDIRSINDSGGGGIIYQGVHRRLGKKVVLKKIRADKISIIGSEREKQILMNLKHRYLPSIIDFWLYEDEIYTVMEFIEGHSFKELLDEGRVFTEKEVIKWIKQLAEVLEYLHKVIPDVNELESKPKIIHSDIKPANLMLTSKNDICLIDFNVSILQGGIDETIGYSPFYSPIEQLLQKELLQKKLRSQKKQLDNDRNSSIALEKKIRQIENDKMKLDNDKKDIHSTELLDSDKTIIEMDTTELLDTDKTVIIHECEKISKKTEKILTEKSVKTKSLMSSSETLIEELIKKYGSNMKVNEQSDIYSACATMYHILTGKKPKPCYEKQIQVEKWLPSVNDALAYILMHGMEQDPKKRFQNSTQFLNAVNRMMKSTKRYKHLLWKQDIAIIFLVALFLGSATATYIGFGRKIEDGLTEKITIANTQYEQMQYEETIVYLEEQVLEYPFYQESPQFSQAYYLLGSCYLEQENYVEAVTAYRKAILLNSNEAIYYRDYGIALVRTGNLEQARECLEQVEVKGLENDSILLLKGEIAMLEKNYTEAIHNLKECINCSEQNYIKLSAALKLDEALEVQYKEDSYLERIELLESLREQIEKDKRLALLEHLVQAYSDYGQLTKEEQYTREAIKILDEILISGYSTLAEWLNKAVLLQSIQEYEQARNCLIEAQEKYPNNYLIYKRLAFLEMDVQAFLEVEKRDYTIFKQYFTVCDALYQTRITTSELDMEMEYLYQIYDEVVMKGWLQE